MALLNVHFRGIRKSLVRVPTLLQASHTLRDIIREHGFGASDQCGQCGVVTTDDGTFIANVSYNGRVWKTATYPSNEIVGDELLKPI